MSLSYLHDFAVDAHTRSLPVDLKGIRSKKALFEILADALKLPAHFGHNWDALADCLMDEDWARAPAYVLVFLDSAGARKRLGNHWTELESILGETADWWAGRDKPFHVILA